MISTDSYSHEDRLNYLKILLIYRRFDLIDRLISLSDETSAKSRAGFVSRIEPIRRIFTRIDRLNNLVSIVFRFVGVNYRTHLIY